MKNVDQLLYTFYYSTPPPSWTKGRKGERKRREGTRAEEKGRGEEGWKTGRRGVKEGRGKRGEGRRGREGRDRCTQAGNKTMPILQCLE